jgi:predicted negative regulator of RcsB-dependent stress response
MEADTTVTLYNIYGWLHTNRKRVLAGAIVVAVIVGVVAILMWHKSQKEADANQALLAVPSLIPTAPGELPSAKTLMEVSQQFSGTSAGTAAELLAAKQLFLDGKYAEAQQQFTKFAAGHSGSPLAPVADVGIAACLEAQGNIGDAVNQYKKINAIYTSIPSVVVPVKLTLGRLSEADNKPAQAITFYRELININDPNDPWVREAYERFQLLVAKHPELNPAPPETRAAAPSPLLTPSAAETEVAAPPAGAGAAPKPAAPPANPAPAAK